MKTYTHIFWDFNGTILDDVDLCHDILNEMLTKYKRSTVTKDEYLMVFDFPVLDYYDRVFDLSKTPFDMLAHEFMASYQPRSLDLKMHDMIETVIHHAKHKGCTNVLLSASEVTRLNEQITHYGIKDLFDDILGTTDIYAASKLDVFLKYMDQNNINPTTCLLIGDTLHDAELAIEVGADVILYTKGHMHTNRLKKYKTIDHLQALIDII